MFFPKMGMIATTNVVTVDIHETITDALNKMHEYNHRSVVVVNGTLYYIITTKDMIRCRMEGISFDTPLSQIYLHALPIIDKESNVIDAVNLINETEEHIGVCEQDGSFYGLVTNSDIISSVDPQVILESVQIATIFDNKYGFRSFEPDEKMEVVMAYLKDSPNDCIIVQHNNLPVGILTSKDILRFIGEHKCECILVGDEMSAPLQTLSSRASISEGLDFLKQHHYKRIVVVDDDGQVIGVVTQQDLISRTYLKWSQLMRDHFRQFEELTEILQQKNRQLSMMATKDALTGIYNRHMFEELFANEHALMKRQNTKLALLIIDIDHFKRVNDTYGHNIGDYVLKTFSSTIAGMIREADVFARWGGEEFVLLLNGISCDDGFTVGEKIRKQIESASFDEVGPITCSIGVSEVKGEDSLKSAVERADKALYAAKGGGRNQTISYRMGGEK